MFIRPPTVSSLKGRLPQKLRSKSTLSCEIVLIHSLFRYGFLKKPKSKFNRNRKTYFILVWRISKNRSWYWFDCKRFSVFIKHKVIFDILFIYFLFHHLSVRKTEGGIFLLTLIQRMFSFMVILFSTKCFVFVYTYIDLLRLKAYKLFENSDADLSWLLFFFFFLKKPTRIFHSFHSLRGQIQC